MSLYEWKILEWDFKPLKYAWSATEKKIKNQKFVSGYDATYIIDITESNIPSSCNTVV